MSKKGFYWLLFIAGFVLLIASLYTVVRLNALGVFVKIEDKVNGTSTVVAEVPGPEALQLDYQTGILYFISNNPCSDADTRGNIYYMELDGPQKAARAFRFDQPKDFHPHGLSFFRSKQGKKILFTNNHRDDGSHTVEIFQILDGEVLIHQQTISGPELTSPNDLAAVGPRQFYVTNDGRSHDRRTRSVDTFLGRRTGNVLYYDGAEFTEVVDNLYFPNGIVIDSRSDQLIVGETLSGMLKSYQMAQTGKLKHVDNFFVGTGIDNISIDEIGRLWVAVHPNLWALSSHMNDITELSPFHIYLIHYQSKGRKLIYQHTGTKLSGVSAVISYNGDLYLGAVCDNKLLRLTIDIDH